jgi:N-methylhydantoinase B
MGAAMYPVCAFSGTDQRGAPYASFLLDPVGAALAGSPWRDGIDTGGWPWDLQSTMPNVEDNEWFYPILYLWRKELANSGGAGKYRGGNSAELAFIPHGTDKISLFTASGHCAVPGPGLHGGLSPATTRFSMKVNANVTQQIRETGSMPTSAEEVRGKLRHVAPKAFDVVQTPNDVFLLSWAGAGGYGDPLERDPERVAGDIQRGNTTREWAREVYGVMLDDHGNVDPKVTEVLRTKSRKARLRKAPKRSRRKVETTHARRVAEGLLLSDGSFACGKCAHEICSSNENYKLHCVMAEHPLTSVNPYLLNPKVYVDDKIVFRSYACPSCGLLIQTELVHPTDPPLWDIQLQEHPVS